jgi:2-isopropylmalate synthase
MDERRILVFDTTLRDGEQSPGATLRSAEKLRLARQLAVLGVDVIEAGFPAASDDDLSAVRRIAERVGNDGAERPGGRPPTICALARATRSDIDAAWEAVAPAASPRIHTFLATSDLHLKEKLYLDRDQALAAIEEAVRYARSLCADVEFSPEDASRTDPAFLLRAIQTAVEAGAGTINLPDTVGVAMPDEFAERVRGVVKALEGSGVVVSVHCHDDLGLATANSLAAIEAGAGQVEVTVNGIGERAGNAALEEVVMILDTHGRRRGWTTGIDTTGIARTSQVVSDLTGLRIQSNKAIVGANAFAHEAGIHQDGVLKHRGTYEILCPERVGRMQSLLVLGKHSGRHAFRHRIEELGHDLDEETCDLAFEAFKELADKKRVVSDADIEAIVVDQLQQTGSGYRLVDLQVVSGRPGMPTATARLLDEEGVERVEAAVGAGPVHAAYRAIDAVVGLPNRLVEFNIHGITEGIDAQGKVTVQIADGEGRSASGYGADTDIIVASAKAYLNALNRMAAKRGEPIAIREGSGRQEREERHG